MRMEEDLSFTIADHTPEVENDPAPTSVTGRVLQRLRVIYPATRTASELVDDPILNGKPAASHLEAIPPTPIKPKLSYKTRISQAELPILEGLIR